MVTRLLTYPTLLGFAFVGASAGVVRASGPAILTPIALQNDVAPGFDGVTYTSTPNWGRSSRDGRLTWQADLSNGQEGIWVYDDQGARPVALAGPGAEFQSFFNQGSGFINSSGKVTLVAERGGEQDIVVVDGASRGVILSTDEQAPGLSSGLSISPGAVGVLISDDDLVSFGRVLDGPGVNFDNDNTLWIGPIDAPRLVLREGDPAPGLPGELVGGLTGLKRQNDRGYLVISDRTKSTLGVIWAGMAGDLRPVATEGAPAPGLPCRFFGSFINQIALATDDDQVLLKTRIVDAADQPAGDALYLGQPDDLRLLLRTGDPSPLGGDETIGSIGNPSINRAGTALQSMTLVANDGGIRQVLITYDLDNPSSGSLIAESGEPAAGVGAPISGTFSGQINDRGDVLYSARLANFGPANFGHGFWLKPADEPTQLVSRVGQTIRYELDGELRQGTLRSQGIPTLFSENGTVGISFRFEQGGGGLFLARYNPVPEPSSSFLLFVAFASVACASARLTFEN